MSRWFRFYDEALNDKKVQRLAPHLFKTWVNLLCLASKGSGKIPSDDDIAFELRLSVSDARQQVEDMILAGLVDILPDGSREPHNWSERQFTSDTSVERTRKYRERLKKKACDVTVTEGVTPPESYSYSDTDREGASSSCASLVAGSGKKRGFNLLIGREDKEGEKLKKSALGLGLDVDELMAVLNERKPTNRSAYFTKLCVEKLQEKHPRLNEGLIRDALWGKGTAIGDVYAVVMGAA